MYHVRVIEINDAVVQLQIKARLKSHTTDYDIRLCWGYVYCAEYITLPNLIAMTSRLSGEETLIEREWYPSQLQRCPPPPKWR